MTAGRDSHNEPSRTGRSSASGRTIPDSFALKLAAVICLAHLLDGSVYLTICLGARSQSRWNSSTRERRQWTSADEHRRTLRVICLHARRR
jgi:hypothetical protein